MVFIFLLSTIVVNGEKMPQEPHKISTHEIYLCEEVAQGDSIMLVFRNEVDGRYMTIMGGEQELAIRRPGEKGLLSWDSIENIQLDRVQDDDTGFLTVFLRSGYEWFGLRTIEFGLMDEQCWNTVRRRFSSRLSLLSRYGDTLLDY